MKKKLIFIVIAFLFCINFVYAEEFIVSSDEVILYNMNDDSILYELDSHKRVQIASLTKIMTAIVAIENIDDLDQEVVITNKMFKGLEGYSKAGFKVGNKVSYLELLYGVMLPSGADAVNAIVYSMGEYDDFIELMNNKALELKLTDTHYDNPIGMDSDENYSSAYDQAILLRYALENEKFYEIFTSREYMIDRYNLKLESTLIKYSNGGVVDVSSILGAKSGFTDGAGLCLASLANLNDVSYLLINLGSDINGPRTSAVRDAIEIYDYYDSNYSYKTVIKEGYVFETIKNKFGYEKFYDIYAKSALVMYLKNDIEIEDLEYIYDGVDYINSDNKIGDKLGVISVLYEGELLASYDVFLNDELEYHYPFIYLGVAILIAFGLMFIRIIIIRNKRRKRRRKKVKKTRR